MLLTPMQCAERLNLSVSKVYRLLAEGRIGHFKIDGSLRVDERQLEEYLESCRRGRRQDPWPERNVTAERLLKSWEKG